jgi:hypothetical protein
MEILYRIYVGVIFGAWGLALLAGAIQDSRVDTHSLTSITRYGPALIGMGIALAMLAALRSGARGGPLAVQGADVHHVLLAPIERSWSLRAPGLRQLRTASFIGLVIGLVIANFALRRLPGSAIDWLGCLALFGALVPPCVLATAMLACGKQLRPRVVNLLGLGLVCWSLLDFLLGSTTSPLTMLGDLATLPVQSGIDAVLPIIGIGVVGTITIVGLRSLGGSSLEAMKRRARLAAELRFAATVQDIRTVILLRRQLASEQPRAKPWWDLKRSVFPGRPIWRRGWRSFLRWPASRIARLALIGVIVGLVLGGAWSGTTPLVAVAGLVLLVAGLDLIEPLAEEFDHPTRRDLIPMKAARLTRQHLIAPVSAMVLVTLVSVLTTLTLGSPTVAIVVGSLMLGPTAILIVCCAALSATNDPYAYILMPQIGYVQTGLPIVLAIAGVALPAWACRETHRHANSVAAAALSTEAAVLIVCAAVIWWLGQRVSRRVTVQTR